MPSACVTEPAQRKVTAQEQRTHESLLGTHLAPLFESRLKQKKEREVSFYLRKIGDRLLAQTELDPGPVGIFLIQNRDNKWENY